jgi:hypothetical protein
VVLPGRDGSQRLEVVSQARLVTGLGGQRQALLEQVGGVVQVTSCLAAEGEVVKRDQGPTYGGTAESGSITPAAFPDKRALRNPRIPWPPPAGSRPWRNRARRALSWRQDALKTGSY